MPVRGLCIRTCWERWKGMQPERAAGLTSGENFALQALGRATGQGPTEVRFAPVPAQSSCTLLLSPAPTQANRLTCLFSMLVGVKGPSSRSRRCRGSRGVSRQLDFSGSLQSSIL